ncbi:hypothetical protein V8E53_004717 [Lactarius tabidus]
MSKIVLFSTVVASFVITSYQSLSPNLRDTTNAFLTQILVSQQLVNISNGTLLTSVAAQTNPWTNQPFKPSAFAVRYQELAQRRGALHHRARMRTLIFDGFRRFGILARAVTPITTLLRISVFLFFAGLVEFLIPIHTTVVYTTLSCIGVFALPYTGLTILPTIHLQSRFGIPLSGIT